MRTVADLKIRMVEIDGVKTIPPEAMAALMGFAEHRNICEQCEGAEKKGGEFCTTGYLLLQEVLNCPDIEVQNIRKK